MKAYIYQGGFSLVKKSGVGKAIEHQKKMLKAAGVPMAKKWKEASVIHINTIFPDSLAAAVLAHCQGKKVIYYGHSTMEDFRDSFKGSNEFAFLFKKWICFCYNRGDIIITPTKYSKKILQGYGIRRRIYSLTNGIDTEFFSPRPEYRENFRKKYHISRDQKVVISIGHYIKRKGILEFFRLAKQMPDVMFLWFGSTPVRLLPQEVKNALKHVPDNVILPGFVDSSQIRDACCGADAFLFMSHEETEGIVVLEALACQTPVLLRDIQVYRDWMEDGKHVKKASNFKEYQTILTEILQNPPLEMAQRGRNLALRHSMKAAGKKLRKIYTWEW